MFRKERKAKHTARAYLWLEKLNKIMAIIAVLTNSLLMILMLRDWNLGMLVFIPNLWVCFLLIWRINRERVERRKKDLIKRDE